MTGSVDLFGNYGATLHTALTAAAVEPVARDTPTGALLVFRHRDVAALARDPRVHGIGVSLFDLMGITEGPLRDWYAGLMFTNEGAEHHRLRALVARAFTPQATESLRRTAADLAAEAMTPGLVDGDDLLDRFALLPTRVMCQLLGVPDRDAPTFANWLDDLAHVFVMMTPDQITAATAAIVDLLSYVDELTTTRRNHPRDDLISALLAAEHDGERLTHEELVRMVANLLVAGHATTISQLGCSLLLLLDGRDEAARVGPSLLGSAVSETIRLEPAIPVLPRTAAEDLRINDEQIPAGSVLFLCTATANRDPAVWKEPDRLDVARFTDPAAPTLLTFGAGPHTCLGTALARVTVEEEVRAVLADGRRYRLAESPADIPWRVAVGRSPQQLLVTAEPL